MSTESNAAQPTGAEFSGVDIVTNNAASSTISIADFISTNGSYKNFVELSKDKTSIYFLEIAIFLIISMSFKFLLQHSTAVNPAMAPK